MDSQSSCLITKSRLSISYSASTFSSNLNTTYFEWSKKGVVDILSKAFCFLVTISNGYMILSFNNKQSNIITFGNLDFISVGRNDLSKNYCCLYFLSISWNGKYLLFSSIYTISPSKMQFCRIPCCFNSIKYFYSKDYSSLNF